jgi:hypothetical protein
MNIEMLVESVSWITWVSELIRETKDNLGLLTQVTSPALVEKRNVLVNDRLEKVMSQVP